MIQEIYKEKLRLNNIDLKLNNIPNVTVINNNDRSYTLICNDKDSINTGCKAFASEIQRVSNTNINSNLLFNVLSINDNTCICII